MSSLFNGGNTYPTIERGRRRSNSKGFLQAPTQRKALVKQVCILHDPRQTKRQSEDIPAEPPLRDTSPNFRIRIHLPNKVPRVRTPPSIIRAYIPKGYSSGLCKPRTSTRTTAVGWSK